MRRRGAADYQRTSATGPPLPRSPFLRPTRTGARLHQSARVRRHFWLALVFALVVALAVLLWGLVASTSRGHAVLKPSRVGIRHAVAKTAPRPTYGWQLAPPAQRLEVKLKLPLVSGVVFNVHTGAVLWQRNPARVLPIASLTKMMTALVVAERSRPGERVLVTRQAVHFSGSGVGLLPLGKRVSLLALLYGLLLPSGNDAAIALAQHVAGTQDRFIALMNQQARQLGLRCTHFTTVSGIVDRGNHSCASDLALLAHRVLENPLLARIVGSRSAILRFPIKGGKLYLYNNNPLLLLGYPGTDGVKTGYTTAAGTCLVATVRRGRAWYGVVLLHSANIYLQAQTLLNAAFAHRG
jgi:serine-type D-Ala-D-Ala carboxypeptidase (penicillin-binding protein 5/6)